MAVWRVLGHGTLHDRVQATRKAIWGFGTRVRQEDAAAPPQLIRLQVIPCVFIPLRKEQRSETQNAPLIHLGNNIFGITVKGWINYSHVLGTNSLSLSAELWQN